MHYRLSISYEVNVVAQSKSKRYSSHGEARTLNLEITVYVKVSRASQLCHAGWNYILMPACNNISVVVTDLRLASHRSCPQLSPLRELRIGTCQQHRDLLR
jgi:hypothetical protein